MPDAVFDHPRLAAVYDVLGSLDRPDLDEYTDIVRDEFPASTVLDIGCGTGAFALRLAKHGIDVVVCDVREGLFELGADRCLVPVSADEHDGE